jgi:hypothetical protein
MSGVTFLLLITVAQPSTAAESVAEKGQSRFASPHEAWEVYRHARHEGQWRRAFRCLTAESQDRFVVVVVMSQSYIDAAADKATAQDLKAVLERHGLDLQEVESQTKSDRSLDGFARELSRRVKDKEGLFDEAMTILSRVLPKPHAKDETPVIAYGPLTKIEVVGDRAKGEFMKQLDARTLSEVGGVRQTQVTQRIEFRRVGGAWLCQMAGGY